MKKYIKAFMMVALAAGFTSCEDYLDEQPQDKIIPENFFTEANNLNAYAQAFYGMFPTHSNWSYGLGTFSADNGTDNQAAVSASRMWVPGNWLVPTLADGWKFENIRKVNYFFDYVEPYYEAGKIGGSESLTRQAIGEAHFFRAYAYWVNYKEIGDYPIFTKALSEDRAELLEATIRQPRNKVARFILNELTKAIHFLPDVSSKGSGLGVNKDVANLFRSRVALFEGTWLKHHKGTALVPGGQGWPGDASLLDEGFNIDTEIAYFLDEAMKSAKIVGDKFVNNLVQNTDAAEGMDKDFNSLNPYYTMFCDVDLSSYSEALLWKLYNLNQSQTTQIQNQFQKNAGGTGWTRGLVNSFLMRNGLPIYDANSGYDPNWENEGVTATLQKRDSRIVIFTKGDGSIDTYSTNDKAPIYWREGWLLDGATETRAVTGFAIKKGKSYDYSQAEGNLHSVTASIIFRAAEALLNYMEACVEKTGAVDGTAEGYWKALRRRAYVDDDYNKTIAATVMDEEAKGDWGAYSAGSYVSPLLYNVRRERRNELIGEALRMDDLRRWAALDQMINTPYIIEGIKYWGTAYADPNSPLALRSFPAEGETEGALLTPVVDINNGTGTMSPSENSAYVRPYQITKIQNLVFDGYRFTRAHYLSPIGQNNFIRASENNTMATTVIYQNPGWPRTEGKGAGDFSGENDK